MNNLEYCNWAQDAVQSYYDKLLILGEENPYINLWSKGGQMSWILDELMNWTMIKEQYK